MHVRGKIAIHCSTCGADFPRLYSRDVKGRLCVLVAENEWILARRQLCMYCSAPISKSKPRQVKLSHHCHGCRTVLTTSYCIIEFAHQTNKRLSTRYACTLECMQKLIQYMTSTKQRNFISAKWNSVHA